MTYLPKCIHYSYQKRSLLLCTFIYLFLGDSLKSQDAIVNQFDHTHFSKTEKSKKIDEFETREAMPMNFEFYVNFGHLILTDELRDNLSTYFEVPLGFSLGYEQLMLNLQYNLVFGNVKEPFEYGDVLHKEKTSYGLMNWSASLGYRILASPVISFAPKVGIISSNLKGLNEEFEENPINYPSLKSNVPVFILNVDFDTMYENDRKKNYEDFFLKNRRKYALFGRLQFLYTRPNYHKLTPDIGEGGMLLISLGFGLHRHFLK